MVHLGTGRNCLLVCGRLAATDGVLFGCLLAACLLPAGCLLAACLHVCCPLAACWLPACLLPAGCLLAARWLPAACLAAGLAVNRHAGRPAGRRVGTGRTGKQAGRLADDGLAIWLACFCSRL